MAFSSLLSNLSPSSRRSDRATELRSFRFDDVAEATSHFHPSALLGRGSHASVFRASLEGGRLLAAAKVVSTPASSDSANGSIAYLSAVNEIEILSSVRSPLLVNLLGVTPGDSRIALVEFMPNGSLYDRLHRPRNRPPTWLRRVRLALQIAEAILALHSLDPPVFHRDIKSSNVLIDDRGHARLADFGLAARGGQTPLPAGTMGYLDPGYVDPAGLSTKSDVFSFGVLLLEIVTGRKAIDFDHSPPALLDWAAPLVGGGSLDRVWDPRIGRPGGRVGSAVAEVAAAAGRCVATVAAERPEMAEVVRWLRAAERSLSSPAGLWERFRRWSRSSNRRRVSHVGLSVVG